MVLQQNDQDSKIKLWWACTAGESFNPLKVGAVHVQRWLHIWPCKCKSARTTEGAAIWYVSGELQTLHLHDVSLCWAIHSVRIRRCTHVMLTSHTGGCGDSANRSTGPSYSDLTLFGIKFSPTEKLCKVPQLEIWSRWNVVEADATKWNRMEETWQCFALKTFIWRF